MNRTAVRDQFLRTSGWSGAKTLPLAGDASARLYFRVQEPDRAAVLMDVADDPVASLPRFLDIGAHLERLGLHPPAVLAADRDAGLLLLEDLGNDLFARVMDHDPESELPLYRAAIDVLRIVQDTPAPDLPAFDASTMAQIAGLAVLAYAGRPKGEMALIKVLRDLLVQIEPHYPVMVLRDFHAENLIWCPDSKGLMRVGLLDFQDAVLGHPVYDVVSLLQDARRDVSPSVEARVKSFARSLPNWNGDQFDFAFALLGAQRALRILGVFARLSLEHGKPGYVDLIPRVWGHLTRNLAHPELGDLGRTVRDLLPEPDNRHLNDLKARCQTLPKP